MSGLEQATFGAGCFWGAEAAFRALPGVVDSRVGYAVEAADEALQIEVVQVDFDPQVLAYTRLIEHFWDLHDPTSVDRQGEHGGVKYRSAIFYTSYEQKAVAEDTIADVDSSGLWPGKVVTESP